MNKKEFESVLYRESVKALYILCRGSEDIITFEESLEHFARFRPIVSNAQVMKYAFNKKIIVKLPLFSHLNICLIMTQLLFITI